jgi:hypothetical protein
MRATALLVGEGEQQDRARRFRQWCGRQGLQRRKRAVRRDSRNRGAGRCRLVIVAAEEAHGGEYLRWPSRSQSEADFNHG